MSTSSIKKASINITLVALLVLLCARLWRPHLFSLLNRQTVRREGVNINCRLV